ncbi:hypothetical protein [Streptomyces canus]|uniref:hypothetical protein n=1 Tax=Streptomyces canus TaxID=58343 RepID=UPI002E25C23F
MTEPNGSTLSEPGPGEPRTDLATTPHTARPRHQERGSTGGRRVSMPCAWPRVGEAVRSG